MQFTVLITAAMAAVAHAGHATYYEPNGNTGACGWGIGNNDWAVALPYSAWSGGSRCGQYIKVRHGSKTLDAKIVDLCPGCAADQIDLTSGLFWQFAYLEEGKIEVDWW